MMKIKISLLITFLTGLFFLGACSEGKSSNRDKINGVDTVSIKKPLGWINDYEKVFNVAETKALDSLVNQFEKETTIEFCILTVDTSMVSKEKLEDYVLATANKWGVGKKEKNNGVIIGFSRGYRKIRIANGYGIEKIVSDKETKAIIEKYFIPNFKNEEYYKGTFEGTSAMMDLLRTKIKK